MSCSISKQSFEKGVGFIELEMSWYLYMGNANELCSSKTGFDKSP